MLRVAFYSNNSQFLSEFPKELGAYLGEFAGDSCRFSSYPLFQISLFEPRESPPDLYVVDIRDDPDRDLAFVSQLRRSAGTEVMAVAPGPQWAMAAYDADVTSYLLDPPDAARAGEIILRRFAQRLRPQEAQFSFRTAEGVKVLSAERIVYVEYSNHRLLIHTDLGSQISTTTMRQSFGDATAQLLRDPRFVRTHASFLVNIMHIAQFGQYVLTMDTGATVPVSHARHGEVKRHFTEFFSRA